MIENKIYPAESIVCITFSNEAANNLILRIDKMFPDSKSKPIIRTFHGFSADLLRKYGDKIGLDKNFKILDPDQAKVILHRNFKIIPANCHKYISTISTAKDLGIKLENFQSYLSTELGKYGSIDLEKRLENLQFELQTLHLQKEISKKKLLLTEISKIRNLLDLKKFINSWSAYEKLKQKGNYQDYSDLSNNSLLLLEKNPEIALEYKYLIIDEFQDTNKIQLDFVTKLATHKNITIVGDLNQSIYRFRGAYKENFSIFKQYFSVKDSEIFNLSKSYRSTNKILRTAHSLILNNYENKDDCIFVENVHGIDGDNLQVHEIKDANEESRKIIELINTKSAQGLALEDICIMFRTHQQSRIVKKALENANLPYYSVSKSSLLKQKSVRTVQDYLIILNKLKKKEKGAEEAWWNLVYNLDFIPADLMKVGKCIKEFSKTNQDQILSVYLLNNLEQLELSESGKFLSKIIIDKIKTILPKTESPISELIKEVYRVSGLLNNQQTREEKEIMLNLNKFYEIAKVHEEIYDSDLNSFLYYLEILENLGIEIEASSLEEKGVRLMTSHSTKGLEFNTVIITNMAQGRFPIERYVSNSLIPTELIPEVQKEIIGFSEEEKEYFLIKYEKHHQLLEERRLAYVSFTRAKSNLIITYALQYGTRKSVPSMFLKEIDYKNNPDINFIMDIDSKFVEPIINKKQTSLSSFITAENLEQAIKESRQDINKSSEQRKFSPSALILFDDCQKEFEYKYVYNMPEKKTLSWDAMRLGSFVHIVLEKGVSSNFKTIQEFLELAKEMSLEEDWESITLSEAETLIRVFFERNKNKYTKESKTEQYLPLTLEGLNFIGFADRIDFSDSGITIVDYKTGKTNISPRDRNWQLGFYALAAENKYGPVRKVILDMLKLERPLEFQIDEKGNAECISSKFIDGFNIYQVKDELISTAKKIQNAYKNGFKPCPIEKNCDFCNEYVYGL
jgi:DNA helicase-2/ATP-dependent DNA helicase PcrA